MMDLDRICAFVDYWLAGRGKRDKVPGAGKDFFVPRRQHIDYLRKYHVELAFYADHLVGWAVLTPNRVLIHLLVAPGFRGHGIGTTLLRKLKPDVVRSKIDQSSGDPKSFYASQGFFPATSERFGRKKNIELLTKEGNEQQIDRLKLKRHFKSSSKPFRASKNPSHTPKSSLDLLREKFNNS